MASPALAAIIRWGTAGCSSTGFTVGQKRKDMDNMDVLF
jgi:hypothetical protein